jgi:tetratricopeptide (TPR) repeat protein
MNTWLFYFILMFLNLRSLTNVSKRNILKDEASKAYNNANFDLAVQKYQTLATISFNLEPEVRLNFAHAYFSVKDTTNALIEYKKLAKISDVNISSIALIQLGIIETQLGDSLEALNLFKIALTKDNQNKIARYNYELLKKKLPQTPPNSNSNQNNQIEQQIPNGGSEADNTDKKDEELDSTTPEKMSKEKALQILEAMKTTELQYSQQRKKSGSKKDKPEKDW